MLFIPIFLFYTLSHIVSIHNSAKALRILGPTSAVTCSCLHYVEAVGWGKYWIHTWVFIVLILQWNRCQAMVSKYTRVSAFCILYIDKPGLLTYSTQSKFKTWKYKSALPVTLFVRVWRRAGKASRAHRGMQEERDEKTAWVPGCTRLFLMLLLLLKETNTTGCGWKLGYNVYIWLICCQAKNEIPVQISVALIFLLILYWHR